MLSNEGVYAALRAVAERMDGEQLFAIICTVAVPIICFGLAIFALMVDANTIPIFGIEYFPGAMLWAATIHFFVIDIPWLLMLRMRAAKAAKAQHKY